MDEEIEPAVERLGDLAKDAFDVAVVADIAGRYEWTVDALRELADVLLDPLALERERQLGSLVGQPLRDRPRDRAAIRDSEYEPLLAFESGQGGRV